MEFCSPVRQRYRRSPPMSDSEDIQIPFSFSPKSLSQRRQRKFALLERLRRSTLLTTVGLAVLLLLLAGMLGSFIFLQYYSGGATIERLSRPEMAQVHSYVMTRGPAAASVPSPSSDPDVAKTTQPAASRDLDPEGRQRRQLKAAMWNTARHRKLEMGMGLNRMGAAPLFENNGSRIENGTIKGFNTSVPEDARSSGRNIDGLKAILPPVTYLNGSIEPSDQSYSFPSKNIDSNFSRAQAVDVSDPQGNITYFSNGVQSLEANFSHVNMQGNDSGVHSAGSPVVPALPVPLQSLSYGRTRTGPLQPKNIASLPDQRNQTDTQPSLGFDRQGERAEFTQHPANQKHGEPKPNALHHSLVQSPNIPLPQNQMPNEELKQLPHGIEQAPQQLASNMQQLNPQPQLQQQSQHQLQQLNHLPQQQQQLQQQQQQQQQQSQHQLQQVNHLPQQQQQNQQQQQHQYQQHQYQQQHLNGLPQQHQQLNQIPQQHQQNLRQEQLDQVPHRLPQQPSQQYQLPEQHLDQSTQERLNQILPQHHQTQLHAQGNDQVIRQQTDQMTQQLQHQITLELQQQMPQGQNQVFQPMQQQRLHQVQNQMPQQLQNQMPQQLQNQMPQQLQNQMPQQLQNQIPQQLQNQMPQQLQNQMPQQLQNQMPQQQQNQMLQQVQNQMPQQVQNQMPDQFHNQMPQHFQPQLQHLFQNQIPLQQQLVQNHVQSLMPQGHQPQWYRTDHGHQSHHQSEQQPNQHPANYQQEQFRQQLQQQQQPKLQHQLVNSQREQESQVQLQNSQTAFSHQYSSFDTQQNPSHASLQLPLQNDISSENSHLSAQNGQQSPQIKQNAEQLSSENIEQSNPQNVEHFSNGSSQQIPTSKTPQSYNQVTLPQFNQPYPLPHIQNSSTEKGSPLASHESESAAAMGASSNDVKQSATNAEAIPPEITDSSKPPAADPVQNLANDSVNAASSGNPSKGSLSVPPTNVEGSEIPSDVKINQDLEKRRSLRVENLTAEKSEQEPAKHTVSPEDVSKISRPYIARNISADQTDPDISNYLYDSGNNNKQDSAPQAETSTSFRVAAESSSFIQASSDAQGTNEESLTPAQENKRRHMKNSELPSVRLRRALQFEQDKHKVNEDKAFPQKMNEIRSTGDPSATLMSGKPVQNQQDNQNSAEAFPQQRVLLHVDESLKSFHTTEQLVSHGFGSQSQFAHYSPQVQHQNPQDQLQNSQVRYQAPEMQHQKPLMQMQTQYQMQDRNQIQQNLPKSFVSQDSSSEPRVFQQRQLLQYQLHDQYGQQNQNLQQHSQIFYNDFGPNVNKHPPAFHPSLQNGQGLTGKYDHPDNNVHSSHEWKDPNLIPVNQFNSMHPNGLFRIY